MLVRRTIGPALATSGYGTKQVLLSFLWCADESDNKKKKKRWRMAIHILPEKQPRQIVRWLKQLVQPYSNIGWDPTDGAMNNQEWQEAA